jgi:hypothetical protein
VDKQIDAKVYQRAFARAKAEGCRIVGKLEYDGITEWSVESPKHPDGYYTVRHAPRATTLTCNCEAGTRGIYCKHRALVHEAAEQEHSAKSAARVTVGALRLAREAALQASLWS